MEDVEMTEINDCEFKTVFSRKKRKMSRSKKEKIFDNLKGQELIVLKYKQDNQVKHFTGNYFSKFHDWLTEECEYRCLIWIKLCREVCPLSPFHAAHASINNTVAELTVGE